MKNLRGIIVAAVFGALTVLLQQLAQRYSLLLDMAYPFASKTVQEVLSEWSGGGFLRLAGNSGRVSDCRSGIHRPDDSVPVEFLPVAGLGLGPRVHRLLSLYLRMGAELLQPPHSRKHEAGDRRLHGGRSARRHGVLPPTGGPAGRANGPG